MASTEKSFTGTGENVTYGATVAAYRYKYDENNQLIRLTQTINGTTWSTEYTYDTDGRQQLIELSNGKTMALTCLTVLICGAYAGTAFLFFFFTSISPFSSKAVVLLPLPTVLLLLLPPL